MHLGPSMYTVDLNSALRFYIFHDLYLLGFCLFRQTWGESKGCLIKGCLNSTKVGIPKTGIPKAGIPKAGVPKVGTTHTATLAETEIPKPGIPKSGIPKFQNRDSEAWDSENGQIHGPLTSDTP